MEGADRHLFDGGATGHQDVGGGEEAETLSGRQKSRLNFATRRHFPNFPHSSVAGG